MRSRSEKLYDDFEDLKNKMRDSLAIVQNPMPIDRDCINMVKRMVTDIREDFNLLYKQLFEYLEDVCLDSKSQNGDYARAALKLLEQANEMGMDGDYGMAQSLQEDGEYILRYLHCEDSYMLPKVKELRASVHDDISLTESIGIIGPNAENLFGYPIDNEKNQLLCNDIVDKLKQRYKDIEFSKVYVGAFIGFNYLGLLAAVLTRQQLKSELGNDFKDFSIDFVLPYKGQHKEWSELKQSYYKNMASLSDSRTCVEDLETYNIAPVGKGEYHSSKIDSVNSYIINNCKTVITYTHTDCKFTERAINIAKSKRKNIIDLYKD